MKNKKIMIIIFLILLFIIGITIYFLSKNKTNDNDNSHRKTDDKKIQCIKNCNNRGKCDSITGSCICDQGFSGDDCSLCKTNFGQNDGCGTPCKLTLITTTDSTLMWTLITSSGNEYNDYYIQYNNNIPTLNASQITSGMFDADINIIPGTKNFKLLYINDYANTGINDNNEFVLDETNNYYSDKFSTVKIFPTFCKIKTCPNILYDPSDICKTCLKKQYDPKPPSNCLTCNKNCLTNCSQDDGCGSGTTCNSTLITLNDDKIKWSLISDNNERTDNFNIIYDDIKFINIFSTMTSDPNSKILFRGLISLTTDIPQTFKFDSITIDIISSGVKVNDIFTFDPKTNYYICKRDSNIKIFPTFCKED